MPDKRSERMGGGNGRLVRGVFFTPFRLPKIPPCSAEENAQERGIASLRSPFGQPAAGYLRCASVPSPQHTASTCGSASPLRPRTFATSALVLSLFCLQPPRHVKATCCGLGGPRSWRLSACGASFRDAFPSLRATHASHHAPTSTVSSSPPVHLHWDTLDIIGTQIRLENLPAEKPKLRVRPVN